MDGQLRRTRTTTRSPKEVQARLDNLPPGAPDVEIGMLRWMLRQQKEYPVWPHAVRRVVDEAFRIDEQLGSIEGVQAGISGQPTQALTLEADRILGQRHQAGDFMTDLLALLSTGADDRSVERLKRVEPPANFLPEPSLDQLRRSFRQNLYFLSDEDTFKIHQAVLTGRPLILGGPAGTGKTECARQIALALNLDEFNENHFGTLFCTPEVTVKESVYEWNDARRLLDLQLVNSLVSSMGGRLTGDAIRKAYETISGEAFGLRYLEIKQLLRHCLIPFRTVCLIDEVDKTFAEFDNVLLDILSRFRFHIPEYAGGPIGRPPRPDPFGPDTPLFVLTSNDTRELSAPLASRCVQVWLKYLPENLECQVLIAKAGIGDMEASRIAMFFRKVRTEGGLRLRQPPSTREVLATATALRKSEMMPTHRNLLEMHCHWVKNRMDFDAIFKKWHSDQGWAEVI